MTAIKIIKHKKLLIILAALLVLIIACVSAFFIVVKIGENKLRRSLVADETVDSPDFAIDENAVYHNGKEYYYNKDLVNILALGVDRKSTSTRTQGQADALYLLSIDIEKKHINIVALSRNTMTDVDILDTSGEKFSSERKQLCLAYAYGINDVSSSENCVRAVSNLLYGIPINNYYTIYLDSVADIVDSVGGVKVTIPSDVTDSSFKKMIGQEVVLKGDRALHFLRMRGNSNEPRLEHQKQFIASFISSAKKAVMSDFSLPLKVFNKLSKESVTNIDTSSFVFLASKATDFDFSIKSVKGVSSTDGTYETFEVDEEALKDLAVECFYNVK